MPTNFASVHAHLENAQAALTGSDETTQRMRETIHTLMDTALKAQFSPPNSGEILPFPGGRHGKTSRRA